MYGTDIEMVLGRMFEADAVELEYFVKDKVAIDWAKDFSLSCAPGQTAMQKVK